MLFLKEITSNLSQILTSQKWNSWFILLAKSSKEREKILYKELNKESFYLKINKILLILRNINTIIRYS